MDPSRLEAVRCKLVAALSEQERARDRSFDLSRRCIRSCSKAIQAVHADRSDEARALLGEARGILDEARGVDLGPGTSGEGLQVTAMQEYAEAALLVGLVEGQDLPPPEELGLPAAPYALGLADLVGELRRRSLDLLRSGRHAEAEAEFERMVRLFELLEDLDFQDGVAPGLRHKRDTARGLIERTREILTQAALARR